MIHYLDNEKGIQRFKALNSYTVEKNSNAIMEKKMHRSLIWYVFIQKVVKASNRALITLKRNKLSHQHEERRRHTYRLMDSIR